MKTVSILHTGDMHMGCGITSFSHDKNILRKQEMHHTCMSVLKNADKYDIVLLAGDVFDSPDVSETVADMFLDAVASCPDTRFFYSCGNHDPYISKVVDYCICNCPPNLHIFGFECVECVEIAELGVRVYGISFKQQHHMSSILKFSQKCSPEYINILCVHGDIASADSVYNPIDIDLIAQNGIDYAALGHVHTFSQFFKNAGLTYAYCGIPEPHRFDETGPMGYVEGTLSKGKSVMKFIPVSKRRYIDVSVDISSCKSYSDILSAIADSLACGQDICRVTLIGENSVSSMLNTDSFSDHIPAFYLEVIDNTHTSYNFKEIARQTSLKGLCAQEVLNMLKDADQDKEKLYIRAGTVLMDLIDKRGDGVDY